MFALKVPTEGPVCELFVRREWLMVICERPGVGVFVGWGMLTDLNGVEFQCVCSWCGRGQQTGSSVFATGLRLSEPPGYVTNAKPMRYDEGVVGGRLPETNNPS